MDVATNVFENYEEEQAVLVAKKRELEDQIRDRYSKAAFTEAQSRVRREGGDTLRRWLNTRSRMERERQVLVDHIREIDNRIMEIKRKLKEERRFDKGLSDAGGGEEKRNLSQEIVTLLTEIRDLLKSRSGET